MQNRKPMFLLGLGRNGSVKVTEQMSISSQPHFQPRHAVAISRLCSISMTVSIPPLSNLHIAATPLALQINVREI
jgi:hypothetical protein